MESLVNIIVQLSKYLMILMITSVHVSCVSASLDIMIRIKRNVVFSAARMC